MIQNKAPGKDVSVEDMAEKFPLASKKSDTHFSKFDVGDIPFGDSLIPIMAGPNMVENEKLIVETAINVKKAGAHFLRGGAFKPLSFPYRSDKYTETREEGIRWLGIAKKETGIGIITEVMEEKYLDLICEVTDILQIGSRNMQNYPLISAAAKTKKPLMIKRHFGASLRDWLGTKVTRTSWMDSLWTDIHTHMRFRSQQKRTQYIVYSCGTCGAPSRHPLNNCIQCAHPAEAQSARGVR